MPESDEARALHARGDIAAAGRQYALALSKAPNDMRLRHDFAVLLMQTRREQEAVELLEEVLDKAPTQAESATVLALCLRSLGRLGRGLEVARLATVLDSRDAIAWLLQGSMEVMEGDFRAGERSLRRCLSLESELAEAWHYLGEALQGQQRWAGAMDAYRHAMSAQPTEVFNIAICAERAGQYDMAREGYSRMCALRPDRADCLARLAQVQAMSCAFQEEAATVARLAAKLAEPEKLAADDRIEAFPLSFFDMPAQAKQAALRRYSASVTDKTAGLVRLPQIRPASPRPRPRIGYLSPDFGAHAIGQLLLHFFAAHDRSVVEVYGYSLRRYADGVGQALRQEFDCFRDCESMGTSELARTIRSDGIDVLIDLAGYTQGARPEALALRPAPVQLGWLGFIHGHEAPWLDAILVDDVVLPQDATWCYSDKAVRLPTVMLPAGPMPAGTPDRKRFGLPEGVPVLASFNNSYKLSEPLVGAWAEILRRASDAWFMVYLPEHARAGFLRCWDRQQGDRERLLLVERLPLEEQADRAASCDLFLDAFRYQAGATGLASLASGLPILCLEGHTPLSRLSVSMNRFLSLEELICKDAQEYIRRASDLANDYRQLRDIRQKLRQSVAYRGLFDPRRCASAIEAICLSMLRATA